MPDGTINFLAPKELTGIIKRIESQLPGYWYSVSQQKDKVTLSLGPSVYCLLDADRAWSLTKEGDKGAILDIPYEAEGFYEKIKEVLAAFVEKVKGIRSEIEAAGGEMPKYLERYRQQSKDDLESLKKVYGVFLRNVDIYRAHNLDIEELYLGSCQLTVDCSIRGTDAKREAFDISVDEKEAIIAGSFAYAMEDLANTLIPKAA